MKNKITKEVVVVFTIILFLVCSNLKAQVVLDTTSVPPVGLSVDTTTTPPLIMTPVDTTTTKIDTTIGNVITTNNTEPTKSYKYIFKEDEKDPTSWSHFRIDGKTEDDKKFREQNLLWELLL